MTQEQTTKEEQEKRNARIECIFMARHIAEQQGVTDPVYICHGAPFCDRSKGEGNQFTACKWCHKIPHGDPRNAGEIETDIRRQQKGH